MTERTRNGKTLAQDATAIVFVLVGGFFAVSVVQQLRGHEAKESFAALTRPVVALTAALGAPAALLLGLGLAALGGLLFVRSRALAPLRPLGALVLGALGLALVLGAFDAGGALGGWLPGLVGGLIGRVVGVILGAALAWLGWMVGLPPSAPRESTAEALQRIGLATRQDAAGVSPAEAALLGNDGRSTGAAVALPRAAPVPKPAAPRREEPLRTETLVPRAPARAEPRPPEPAEELEAASSALTPPTPSWEALEAEAETLEAAAELDEREEPDEPAQDLATLRASRAEVFPAREEAAEAGTAEPEEPEDPDGLVGEDADEEHALPAHALHGEEGDEDHGDHDDDLGEDLEEEPEELAAQDREEALEEEQELQAAEPPLPSAAWEQVGLFDELEEPASGAKEPTPSFDFDAPAPAKARPAPAPAATPRAADDPFAARPAPEADFTLTPAAPRPAPAAARDDAEERWQALVYEAGCLILDQKRVAVSMLERRFSIDFDAACKVLDELQQAGLIGPYIGGRSRDILLSREEWLSHAPHAS